MRQLQWKFFWLAKLHITTVTNNLHSVAQFEGSLNVLYIVKHAVITTTTTDVSFIQGARDHFLDVL